MTDLFECVREGDLAGVQRAIEEDASKLNAAVAVGGGTPLLLAIVSASPETTTLWLLERGAEVDLRNDAGWTALILASRRGELDIVRALLERGAQLDLVTNKSWSALMFAARFNQPEIADALIAHGAQMDLKDNKGWTALMLASRFAQPKVVEVLLKSGAAFDVQCDLGWTALMLASQEPAEETLAEKTPVEAEDLSLRCVTMCWGAGADPHLRQSAGHDALSIAESTDRTSIKAFLRFATASRVARLLLKELTVPRTVALALWKSILLPAGCGDETTIGDAGAQALAQVLPDNTTVATLDLSNGRIGAAGVRALARALQTDQTLIAVDLCGNAIGNEGGAVLAQALELNSTLQEIWLDEDATDRETLGRIQRRRLKVILENGLVQSDQLAERMTGLAMMAKETCKARETLVKAFAFYDSVLQESLFVLASMINPLTELPSKGRMLATQKCIVDLAALQKAVVADTSLAQRRNEKRAELVQRMRGIVSDGLEETVAGLAANAEHILATCERAWHALFCTPLVLVEPGPAFVEVKAAGRVLQKALAGWKARHKVTQLQELNPAVRAVLQTVAQDSRPRGFDFKLAKLERALRKETEPLTTPDPLDDAPRAEIRSALLYLGSFFGVTVPGETNKWRTFVDLVEKQVPRLVQGMAMPDVGPLVASLDKVRRARVLNSKGFGGDGRKSGHLDDADDTASLSAELLAPHEVSELEHAIRIERASVLSFAREQYPELLRDDAWCMSIGIPHGALIGVGKRDLWLGNASVRDFAVEEQLAEKAGRTIMRVRDQAGRDLVLKTLALGSEENHGRFYRLVHALAKVDSAFVVRIESLFFDGPHLGCILMPFYPGGDLGAWIRDNPHASVDARKRIAVGILAGAHDLHQRGLVHGDIRPENILLTEDLSPALGTPGSLLLRDDGESKYLAPELRAGNAESAADIFAICVVLRELFSECAPALAAGLEVLALRPAERRPRALQMLRAEAFRADMSCALHACMICRGNHAKSAGASCAAGHFACSSCLSETVRTAARQPGASAHDLRDGYLRCVASNCQHALSGEALAACVPMEDFASLLQVIRGLNERDVACAQEREVRRRVEVVLQEHGLDTAREQEREVRQRLLAVLQGHNKETLEYLQIVVDDILVVSCPRCWMVFDDFYEDFDGRCAIKCLGPGCSCYFCAWCHQDTGDDRETCDRHVAACSANANQREAPEFSPLAVVTKGWGGLREQELQAYFKEKIPDRKVRAVVRDKLVPIFMPDDVLKKVKI